MRKIRLNLDALDVDTFEPGSAAATEGTVHAHAYSNLGTCGVGFVATCQYQGTCAVTCWSGCGSQTRLCVAAKA